MVRVRPTPHFLQDAPRPPLFPKAASILASSSPTPRPPPQPLAVCSLPLITAATTPHSPSGYGAAAPLQPRGLPATGAGSAPLSAALPSGFSPVLLKQGHPQLFSSGDLFHNLPPFFLSTPGSTGRPSSSPLLQGGFHPRLLLAYPAVSAAATCRLLSSTHHLCHYAPLPLRLRGCSTTSTSGAPRHRGGVSPSLGRPSLGAQPRSPQTGSPSSFRLGGLVS